MNASEPKRYWKSLAEYEAGTQYQDQAEIELAGIWLTDSQRPDRRDFLKAAGFSFAGAMLSACRRAPVEKAVPWLEQPEGIVAGRTYEYASTCGACPAACGLCVRTRDGRPIKLEGNPQHPLSRGGLCAVGQSSLLGLYDSLRPGTPLSQGRPVSWAEADRQIRSRLEEIRRRGGLVRYLSGIIHSPSKLRMIRGFLSGFPGSRHVVYDTLSCPEIAVAHERTHGKRVLPRFRFERAEVIASFEADFLGTWLSPVEFTSGYSLLRKPGEKRPWMSYHVQFESRLSVTGCNADRRVAVAPEEIPWYLAQLCARLAVRAGHPLARPLESSALLDELSSQLWEARGRSLVLCGAQDLDSQLLANFANELLGNYGATLDVERPSLQQWAGGGLEDLLDEVFAGKVAALFVDGVNPVYDLPNGAELREALKRLPLVVRLAERIDETGEAATILCPEAHYLESWGDAEPVRGLFSIQQPVIATLRGRSSLESLALWSGSPRSAYEIVRETWEHEIYPVLRQRTGSFRAFWEQVLRDGWVEAEADRAPVPVFHTEAVKKALEGAVRRSPSGLTLVAYPKVALRDGRHAYNPWLQELPDPVTKVVWDNYACLAPAAARRLGVSDGDLVRLEVGGRTVELPALVQPGQHESVVAVALGYGGVITRRFADLGPRWLGRRSSVNPEGVVGKNVAPLLELERGTVRRTRPQVTVTRTGARYDLASTQAHHTLTVPKNLSVAERGRRPVVQETTLAAFRKDPFAGSEGPPPPKEDLWPPDHPFTGHRWVMAVDLTACTGCSACVIACQVENNIPVVGKNEVARKREMHWIRIDRYYSGPPEQVEVAFQPMMCQHCEHAPCETVCPVLATVHSSDGLNQQIYNRCIGTRYCENNCPYKVRRFNWFDYRRDDQLANLVLNPDVTVRSRGVMEKCTFCVQRIQEARLEAKRRGKPLRDGDVETACQQSCPARAIVFGDANDPRSQVAQRIRSGRAYRVLEELNVRPSVVYLRLVRNRPEEERHG